MIVTDKYCEDAVLYLAKTDLTAAQHKVEVERLTDKITAVKAAIFKRAEGSVEMRKAEAETAPEIEAERALYYQALLAYEAMRNKRSTAALVTELWRSVNSNRRAGIMT